MKRILSITITSLLVVVGFTCLKYYTFGRLLPNANFGMRAICNLNDVSDVYIGSSMFRQGINARGISDKSFLLAYNSNKPCHEAMQVKNLIENEAKFNRLIVDMYPYSMIRGAEISDVRMLMDGDMSFTWNVYSSMPSESRTWTMLYNMLVLQNNELFATLPISYGFINSRSDRGSNTSISNGKTRDEIIERYEKSDREIDTDFKQIQIDGIDEIITLCRDNKIELVFLETPKFDRLYGDNEYVKMMKEYTDLLLERNISIIMSNRTKTEISEDDNQKIQTYFFDEYNPVFFTDVYHISFEGRQVFTEILNELIN